LKDNNVPPKKEQHGQLDEVGGSATRKPLRPNTLPLWELTGLSTFQTGCTVMCGGHSLNVAPILMSFSIFLQQVVRKGVSILAGLVRTGLYRDFFYIYFTE